MAWQYGNFNEIFDICSNSFNSECASRSNWVEPIEEQCSKTPICTSIICSLFNLIDGQGMIEF